MRVIYQNFEIEPIAMVVTASCGVIFNIIMFFILHTNKCFGDQLKHHGHSHSGDGHGHGHSHNSNSNNSHGHSHSNHSHSSSHHGHNHSHSVPTFKSTSSNSMPINDNYISNPAESSAYIESDEVDFVNSACDTDHRRKAESSNINLRAAAIHVIGDFIQSVGVLIASIIIYFKVSIS